MNADLIILARNRLEYTKKSLETLAANTDFSLVSTATVYDDMSSDGTGEWLAKNVKRLGFDLVRDHYRSVVLPLRAAIENRSAPYIAKIDNDTMVPRGWLNVCVEQMERNAEVDLLGIEAQHGCEPDVEAERVCERSTHIGGIGLMRRSAFDRFGKPEAQSTPLFGFTEWQHSRLGEIHPAWLVPSLPVSLLDHVPFEPWRSLKQQYIENRWQRHGWGEYPDDRCALWEWWEPRWRECQ